MQGSELLATYTALGLQERQVSVLHNKQSTAVRPQLPRQACIARRSNSSSVRVALAGKPSCTVGHQMLAWNCRCRYALHINPRLPHQRAARADTAAGVGVNLQCLGRARRLLPLGPSIGHAGEHCVMHVPRANTPFAMHTPCAGLESTVGTVFTPCGHMCCCVNCGLATSMDRCPICRIRGRAIKVFRP